MAEQRRKPEAGMVPRRAFLKTAAAVAGGAAVGGIPGILRAGQAPAYPKGTKLHMLQQINFVPAGDKVFVEQAAEFGKQMGVDVQVERIGQNDVPTRSMSAVEMKAGPDIILIQNNFPHLIADGVADVGDVAEALGKSQGGYYDVAKANCFAGGRWLGVPHDVYSWGWNYRESWLREVGYNKFPETWDEFRIMGKKLKAAGRPVGQCFGHSTNDPNNYCYALIWCFGGYEVEKDGKTVVLDKKGTLESLKLNTAMWKESMDEGGLSWDDASNNRAFLAGSLSVTGNSPSIYFVARDKFPEVYNDMNHAPMPKGPAGRFYQLPTYSSVVMKYSKNQKLAKEFIRWYMAKEQYEKWFEVMDTFSIPPTKMWYDHPVWVRDRKNVIFRDVIKDSRWAGYAGPPGRKASEAMAKYIIVDMFAKAIQGTTPEEALKWGTAEMKKIYAG
ncbi:MAG TPA: extracellular solute-binding protein [Candidatus Methylomirabilis sp.]|nr:extracellular solute-binding protein [Candidatus Methylomirabilis sp.]